MTNPRTAEIKRLTGLIVLLFSIGFLLGHVAWVVLAGLSGYFFWHLKNLLRLEYWLSRGSSGDPPDARGIWGEVFNHIYRLQQRHRNRKQKLKTIVARFQESTSAMPDATVVLDAEARILWFNKAAQRLLGLRPVQDRGQRIDNLLRQPAFTAFLARGDYAEPVEIASPLDENLLLSVRIVPYGREQRLLLARDVTRLQQLERVRRDFVTNVSHELRTPLTVLSGYLESIEDIDTGDAQWRRALKVMEQQTSRMRHIVDDLLLLSRLETGKPQDNIDPVPVAALLATIREDARVLSGDAAHTIVLEADEGLYLKGNEKELYSAFSNLVFNAVKYTPEKGTITVRWHLHKDSACFEVQDNGIGIPKRHIPRLTERFYRVDVGRSRDQGGTGLGLAIVKHVLGRHNAELHVDSEPGKGSTFSCTFPAYRIIKNNALAKPLPSSAGF